MQIAVDQQHLLAVLGKGDGEIGGNGGLAFAGDGAGNQKDFVVLAHGFLHPDAQQSDGFGKAGAATGTYGLFRDLAAPFGVAVFVPLFTNQITARIAAGSAEAPAAVASIHFLAMAELLCVALGIAAIVFLPKRKAMKEN